MNGDPRRLVGGEKESRGGVGNFYHQGSGRRSSHEWRSVKAWKPAEGVTLLPAFSSPLLPADLIVLGGDENIRHAPHGVGEVRGRIISDIGFSAWNIQYRSPSPGRTRLIFCLDSGTLHAWGGRYALFSGLFFLCQQVNTPSSLNRGRRREAGLLKRALNII